MNLLNRDSIVSSLTAAAIVIGLLLSNALWAAESGPVSYALTGFAHGDKYVLDSSLTESDCSGALAVARAALALTDSGESVRLTCEASQ